MDCHPSAMVKAAALKNDGLAVARRALQSDLEINVIAAASAVTVRKVCCPSVAAHAAILCLNAAILARVSPEWDFCKS